jgi:hypothetical protein
MTTITVVVETAVPPERVVAAAFDFSERRCHVFPAVSDEHLEVHEVCETSADVTEGTRAGIGINWERCRYDWSQPGSVTAYVTDSNVYALGSSWQITARPTQDGSHVEMRWDRTFKRTVRGLVFGTLFRVVGRPIFRKYGRQIIDNLEELDADAGGLEARQQL